MPAPVSRIEPVLVCAAWTVPVADRESEPVPVTPYPTALLVPDRLRDAEPVIGTEVEPDPVSESDALPEIAAWAVPEPESERAALPVTA